MTVQLEALEARKLLLQVNLEPSRILAHLVLQFEYVLLELIPGDFVVVFLLFLNFRRRFFLDAAIIIIGSIRRLFMLLLVSLLVLWLRLLVNLDGHAWPLFLTWLLRAIAEVFFFFYLLYALWYFQIRIIFLIIILGNILCSFRCFTGIGFVWLFDFGWTRFLGLLDIGHLLRIDGAGVVTSIVGL